MMDALPFYGTPPDNFEPIRAFSTKEKAVAWVEFNNNPTGDDLVEGMWHAYPNVDVYYTKKAEDGFTNFTHDHAIHELELDAD